MALRAKDLMIGDWVKFTSKYGYGTGQVVGIEPREGSAEPTTFTIWKKDKEGNTKFFVGVSKNCVDPIPLTPEILEKNGFKNEIKLFVCRNGEYNILWWVEGFWLEVQNLENGNECSIYCPYAHLLQHALRLCGIEKEIEL